MALQELCDGDIVYCPKLSNNMFVIRSNVRPDPYTKEVYHIVYRIIEIVNNKLYPANSYTVNTSNGNTVEDGYKLYHYTETEKLNQIENDLGICFDRNKRFDLEIDFNNVIKDLEQKYNISEDDIKNLVTLFSASNKDFYEIYTKR